MSDEVQDEQINLKGRKDVHLPSDEPSPETFNLEDFLQEKSTVPTVGVTVYLDADGGRQLQTAYEKKAAAEQRLAELETMPNPVLGVGESNPLLLAKNEAETVKQEAQTLIDQLSERVVSSALYLEFQAKDSSAISRSQKTAREDLPEGFEDSMSEQEVQSHFVNYAAAACCIRITNPKQQTIEGPFPPAHFYALREKLIQTENTKLVAAMNESIGMGNTWAEKLDAGFPGGSPHVAG